MPVSSYSKGMRQKVLLSAALLHNPELILLDEPFSGLDVGTGLVLRSLIQELAARGKVILFSSHELETVERVSSRVVILHRGKVVADDSIENLRNLMALPTLEKIFSQLAVEQDTGAMSREIADLIQSVRNASYRSLQSRLRKAAFRRRKAASRRERRRVGVDRRVLNHEGTQFRILYRQFLFRMVDLELLSADAKGDMSKLFGQFAALLIFISIGAHLAGGHGWGSRPAAACPADRRVERRAFRDCHDDAGGGALRHPQLGFDVSGPARRNGAGAAADSCADHFFRQDCRGGDGIERDGGRHCTCSRDSLFPLSLNHRHEAVTAPPIGYDAAMAPLDVAGLGPVLKHDLAPVLGAGGGVTVGVWKHGERRVFAYGTAKPDSIFQIASITKTFTATGAGSTRGRGEGPPRRTDTRFPAAGHGGAA